MRTVKKGATDQTFYVKMVDSAAGTPETALTITNIDLTYTRNRAAAVKADATALATVDAAHSDNTAFEVSSTNAPGLYRVDFPDAAFASGVDNVILTVTCTGCDPAHIDVQLVDNIEKDTYDRIGAPAGASIADDLVTIDNFLDTEVAAIKAKTDNLPASPAATGDAMALTSSERNSVADAILDRNMATGTDSGSPTVRTVRQALRFLRNKWAVSAGTLTVYKEDDTTSSWTATVGTDAGAAPIVSNDPA